MNIFLWISLAAAGLCLLRLLISFVHLAHKGLPNDLATPQGSTAKGIVYAHTVAMSPTHKESAYKHLPTYTAGIIYHLGTFLSLLLYVWVLCCRSFGWHAPRWLYLVFAACLLISTVCGIFIFGKRCLRKDLRSLSVPDDYISNGLVTGFQGLTALLLIFPHATVLGICTLLTVYALWGALLFLWIPCGKIRHLLYYFLARTHLGVFYGRRGTWPPAKESPANDKAL